MRQEGHTVHGLQAIIDKNMDTTILSWDYIGIMENEMETLNPIVYWVLWLGILNYDKEILEDLPRQGSACAVANVW